jgi:hypothetical protein
MIRAPCAGIRWAGSTRVGPKRSLKRRAISRNHRRPVGEHVRGLQDRVVEQAGRDEGPAAILEQLPLRLPLVHAVEIAPGGDGREQPAELGVLADVALTEEDAALRVEPGGEQDRDRVVDPRAELGRLVVEGDRVQVDDAVDRFALGDAILALDVLTDRSDVVAEVLAPGRLDAAEDPIRRVRG